MLGHKIGTREEWEAARDELAKLETEPAGGSRAQLPALAEALLAR
jgi:hypothetical protein